MFRGGYGSEGFIAYLDREEKLVWVIYSENSIPSFLQPYHMIQRLL